MKLRDEEHQYKSMMPHKIKSMEEGRINPAYINVSEKGHFEPVPGVTYLWVLSLEHEIIMGIQKPWAYPEAFHFDLEDPAQKEHWDIVAQQLKSGPQNMGDTKKSLSGFGHPTLGVKFRASGEVNLGACYLGGELSYTNNQWVVNNKSGRYGRKKEEGLDNQKEIEGILRGVADEFQRIGISVRPELILKHPDQQFNSDILAPKKKDPVEISNEFKARIMSQKEESSSSSSTSSSPAASPSPERALKV